MSFVRDVRAVEWLYLAVGLVAVSWNFFFFDDAFVYFRYVDNLVWRGIGLVYNEGEYVEGFTSPLWTLWLAGLRVLGLDWVSVIRAVSLASFVVFWGLGVRSLRSLAPAGVVVNVPLAWLCGLYGVTTWFSSGSESPFALLLAPAYALFVSNPSSLLLQLAMAASPLVRPELTASLGVALLWAWLRGRRFPWRFSLLSLLLVGGWTLFRVIYYADWVPNTFRLKNVWDPAQGVTYLLDATAPYFLIPLLGVSVLAGIWLWRRGEPIQLDRRAAMWCMALPPALYTLAIGGTSTHFRYLAFPLCLLVFSTGGLLERVLARMDAARRGGWLGFTLVAVSLTLQPPQLDVPHFNIRNIADAAYHRWRIDPAGSFERVLPRVLRRASRRTRDVAVDGWCLSAWANLDQRVVHHYGLTDAVLSRARLPRWRPGHPGGMARRMAEDIASLQRLELARGRAPGTGMYRRAVEAGGAPDWVAPNLETLERIERQIYNRHDLLENLRLVLDPAGDIIPVEEEKSSSTDTDRVWRWLEKRTGAPAVEELSRFVVAESDWRRNRRVAVRSDGWRDVDNEGVRRTRKPGPEPAAPAEPLYTRAVGFERWADHRAANWKRRTIARPPVQHASAAFIESSEGRTWPPRDPAGRWKRSARTGGQTTTRGTRRSRWRPRPPRRGP